MQKNFTSKKTTNYGAEYSFQEKVRKNISLWEIIDETNIFDHLLISANHTMLKRERERENVQLGCEAAIFFVNKNKNIRKDGIYILNFDNFISS